MSKMARNINVIPDLYFPTAAEVCSASGQELQNSDSEEEGWQHLEVIPGQREHVDLSKEGFIPIHKLTLGDLPEPISTEENFRMIMDLSKRVVRINNNGLSDKRQKDKETKISGNTLTGSGFLLYCNDSVHIVTNRHVLYDDEEMAKATFDVFFDYENEDPDDKSKLSKRCGHKDGKVVMKMTYKYDLSIAEFVVKDEMISHINNHCLGLGQLPRLWLHNQKENASEDSIRSPTVCLISHPLGQAKQVSFGQALDYDPVTGILHHNAPSREGSSGAPVLVFTTQSAPKLGDCIIYHVGTEVKTRIKDAAIEKLDHYALDKEQTHYTFKKRLSAEKQAENANASLDVAALAACAPALGAFLLLAEGYHLLGLDAGLLKPCKAPHSDAHLSSHTFEPCVKDMICKLAEVVPAFSLAPSSNADDVPEVVSLVESQRPCFCRSIVKLMERGSKSDRGTVTEAFISPYTMAVKMLEDSDVTWPWLIRDGSAPICHDEEEEECLLRKCLMLCKHDDGIFIPVILLHLIVKANDVIRHLFPHHCDALMTSSPCDEKRQEETTCSRQVQMASCGKDSEGRPDNTPTRRNATTCPVDPLTGDWLGLVKGVLALVSFVLRFCSTRCEHTGLNNNYFVLSKQTEQRDHLDSLFSRCLARSEHIDRHRKQVHPDRGRPGQEDSDTEPCPCGRPSYLDVVQAMEILMTTVEDEQAGEVGAEHTAAMQKAETIAGDRYKSERNFSVEFNVFLMFSQRACLIKRPGNPGRALLESLGKQPQFAHGHDSLMLSLASSEAILYNSCMLARYISKHLQPLYIASPVSVFGRPGNWPGNVTPPEVQRTAWRLIQDAIMASGFRPAVLADLEKDAERRSKLIDVYVDMKQLKWEKKILPSEFEEALEHKERFAGYNVFRDISSFPTTTCYFVFTVHYLLGGGKKVFQ